MRWQPAWIFVLALVTLTGCPKEFGKEGRIERAAHKDVMERLRANCSMEDYNQFCSGDREHTQECLEQCG